MEGWAREEVVDGERMEFTMRAAQWKQVGENIDMG